MKKLITILFFAGVLNTAFAQSDRHHQNGNQANDNRYQSSTYSRDNNSGYSKSYPDNNGYNKNNERDNRNNENDYGYTNNREDRHRNDDMRRNQNYYPQYGNKIEMMIIHIEITGGSHCSR